MAAATDHGRARVVAVVGSAGAIGALQVVLAALPSDLDASVVVVVHLTPTAPSVLPAILARRTDLRVTQAADGDALEPGIVRVAPPDAHLLVTERGTLRLEYSELVHHVRPSADVLLLSLAGHHRGPLAAIKQAGGRVLAQDEATAQYFGMPGAAILAGGVDEVLPLDAIGPAVIEWTTQA